MEHNLTEPKWESEGTGESQYETHVVVQAVFQILAHNENILSHASLRSMHSRTQRNLFKNVSFLVSVRNQIDVCQ